MTKDLTWGWKAAYSEINFMKELSVNDNEGRSVQIVIADMKSS